VTALIAIDPGLRTTGWALFEEVGAGSVLIRAGISRSTAKSLDDVMREHDESIPKIGGLGRVVVEQMQVYGIQHSKGDPQDLIHLSILGGYLVKGRNGAGTYVEPKTWKGQRPKNTIEPLVKKHLSAEELARAEECFGPIRAKSLLHNAWEAIGIGLWALGRWPR
jgi:hypothetical protein